MKPESTSYLHDTSRAIPADAEAAQRAEQSARDCAERLRSALLSEHAHAYERAASLEQDTALRACLKEYVSALKALKGSPEQVLIAVKRLIAAAGLPEENRTALTRAGVAWMIEAYYSG